LCSLKKIYKNTNFLLNLFFFLKKLKIQILLIINLKKYNKENKNKKKKDGRIYKELRKLN